MNLQNVKASKDAVLLQEILSYIEESMHSEKDYILQESPLANVLKVSELFQVSSCLFIFCKRKGELEIILFIDYYETNCGLTKEHSRFFNASYYIKPKLTCYYRNSP